MKPYQISVTVSIGYHIGEAAMNGETADCGVMRRPWELRGPTQIYGNLQQDQNGTGDQVAVTTSPADAAFIVKIVNAHATAAAMHEAEPTEAMCIAGEEAYWSAPKDEDRCTAMAAAYRAMRAAAKADAPDPHVLQDRLHGMLRMAVASEDSFNRLSPAGRRLIQAAEGFFASSREDRDDLNACWDALQAETKRADAAEARLAALEAKAEEHPA